MKYYPNYKVFVLNRFEKCLLCYLLGMGFAKVVNVIVELNQKKHIPKVTPSPVIKTPFSNKEIIQLVSIVIFSTGLIINQRRHKKNNKVNVNHSNLNRIRGGHISSDEESKSIEPYCPEYDPKLMDPEEYFEKRIEFMITKFLWKQKLFKAALLSLGFKDKNNCKIFDNYEQVKFFEEIFKLFQKLIKIQRVTIGFDKTLRNRAIKCLPENDAIYLLTSNMLTETIRDALAIPVYEPIAITLAFFSLFIRQYPYLVVNTLNRVWKTFRYNVIVNFLQENILFITLYPLISTFAFFINLKVFYTIKVIQNLKNFPLIKFYIQPFIETQGQMCQGLLIVFVLLTAQALYSPCYDYFLPLHGQAIEILMNNAYPIKGLGYKIPDGANRDDSSAVFVAATSEMILDNKDAFSDQEIFERSSFPNSKTSLTNMCEPDRAIYKLTTLELTDVPILGETSLDSLIKDNIKDFETIALTESEHKFLNTFKEQVIDVKAEKMPPKQK